MQDMHDSKQMVNAALDVSWHERTGSGAPGLYLFWLFVCVNFRLTFERPLQKLSLFHGMNGENNWHGHDQREPNSDLCRILGANAGSSRVCIVELFPGFKWMSSKAFPLSPPLCGEHWDSCWNGRGGGIPHGDPFICRLPSCLPQIFHKVLWFWDESEMQTPLL